MASRTVSGGGVRRAVVAVLDENGFPNTSGTTDLLTEFTRIGGIKTVATTDPEPQRFTHYGDDSPYAQDSLPPSEVGSFTFTTSRSNMTIDSLLEGNSTVTIGNIQVRAANTNKRGSEPLVMFAAYRQALDTDDDNTGTFGKLRQWQLRIYPSTRISPASESFEQLNTDKTYNATPTPVASTPWGQAFTEAIYGNTSAEYVDITTDYQPQLAFGEGNGVKASFSLPYAPVSSSNLKVWVDGTLQTPSAVNISTTNPAFTLSTAPGSLASIFALIETNQPGGV
jgi:hypothetical protein